MLNINEERLWGSMVSMGGIGALPNGGCRRLALTDEDRSGRDLLVNWCKESGCRVDIDSVGNIYARRPGSRSGLPAVATGSHLDTQPHGGKFDGVYGVLAGLEVIRSLNDAHIRTRLPIEVIVWTNEEGARFSPPLAGSSVFCGSLAVDDLHRAVTHDGRQVGDELERIGYLGEQKPGDRKLDCFFEAHIEQGPVLESAQLPVGIVYGVQGIRWYGAVVEGVDAHAGTVPMHLRRDALTGAAQMVTRVREVALNRQRDARLTVGRFDVSPNSGSTIPGRVSFNIDLRHPDQDVLDDIETRIFEETRTIAQSQRLGLIIDRTMNIPPVRFDDKLVSLIRDTADGLEYGHMDMISGAGHDAMNVASKVPAAMIFVPCKDGISHNEAEYASPGDLAAGANVLLNAILARAGCSS